MDAVQIERETRASAERRPMTRVRRGAAWLSGAGLAGLVGLLLVGGAAGQAAQAAGPGGPPAAQLVPGDRPSIAVLGSGGASGPAESGRLQVVLRAVDPYAAVAAGEVVSPVGPGQVPVLAEEQVQPVVEALVAVGVPEESVALIVGPAFGGAFGPGSAQILVDLDGENLGRAEELVQAATTAAGLYGLYVESVGAGYQIDACDELLQDARTRAAEDGRERAEELAEALGVELGGLLLASEVPSYNDGSGYGCSAAAAPPAPYQGLYLPPFDPAAVPAVVAYVQLNLSYEIVEATDATPEP